MQVVEFADAGESPLQHFCVSESGNGRYIIGRQPVEKPVHHLAPGPEIVVGRPTPFGQTGHAALERVAVHVGEAGNCDFVAFVSPGRAYAGLNPDDPSVGRLDAHVARPAVGQQCRLEPKHRHRVACHNTRP